MRVAKDCQCTVPHANPRFPQSPIDINFHKEDEWATSCFMTSLRFILGLFLRHFDSHDSYLPNLTTEASTCLLLTCQDCLTFVCQHVFINWTTPFYFQFHHFLFYLFSIMAADPTQYSHLYSMRLSSTFPILA